MALHFEPRFSKPAKTAHFRGFFAGERPITVEDGFEFSALGRATGFAPFGDILHAVPGSLDHLIMGAASPVHIAVAEAHGYIVAELGDLEAFQAAIPAMFRDQGFRLGFHGAGSRDLAVARQAYHPAKGPLLFEAAVCLNQRLRATENRAV